MTRPVRLVVVLPALLVLLAPATAARAQTPFALQNVGQRAVADDARMVARGFGMTVTDSLHPGFKNVSSLASLRHVALKFTGYGERVDSRDATGERRTYRTYSPDVRVALPVLKSRLAVTAGFSVDRTTAYHTRRDTGVLPPFWNPPEGETETPLAGNFQFIREGSLYTVPLGVAFQALPGISLGANLNLVRGSNVDTGSDRLPQTVYENTTVIAEEIYNGTSTTLSFLLAPGRRIRAGISWTPPHDVEVDRKVELQGVAQRARSTFTMRMPQEVRAGVEARVLGRWRIGADAHFAEFSKYRGREDWEQTTRDEYAWSAGLERIQARARRGGLSNLPLRIGTGYRRWAYTIGGAPVEEWTYAVGTGFPFRGDMGHLDLAVSWSQVGDRADNGYESEIWRLTVSVTGLETWW